MYWLHLWDKIRAAGHQAQARTQRVRKRESPHVMDRSQEEKMGGWKQEIRVMEGAERIKIKNRGQRPKDRGGGEVRVSDIKPLQGAYWALLFPVGLHVCSETWWGASTTCQLANYTTYGFSNGVNTTVIGDRQKEKDEGCTEMGSLEGREHMTGCCGGGGDISPDIY